MIKLAPFVCRTVPERVCQAENGFHLVFCAKVARGVTRCFLLVLSLSYSIVELLLLCNSSRLSSPREVAIVLFKGDCSQHIPSQGTAHDSREQLCLVIGCGRCGFILVRIPHRKGHSIQRDVLLGCDHCWPRPPHPRSDSRWPKREGSQVAPQQLKSNNRSR